MLNFHYPYFLLCLGGLIFSPTTAHANDYPKKDKLGILFNTGSSQAWGVSDDGMVVVGESMNNARLSRPFLWTQSGVMENIGRPQSDSSGTRIALGVSGDGKTVIGHERLGGSANARAVYWTRSGGWSVIAGAGSAQSVNQDGTVIVGGATGRGAFRWTKSGDITYLKGLRTDGGSLAGEWAYDVSNDGNSIVGATRLNSGQYRATLWTVSPSGTQIKNLGILNGFDHSQADAISGDGTVVVGTSFSITGVSKVNPRAFRWTQSEGMIDLGTINDDNSGVSSIRDVNADGSVIVGYSKNKAGTRRAFRWTQAMGMVDLGTFKSDNSGEATANGVNADGSIVVGYAQDDTGNARAFIWRKHKMLDVADTTEQIAKSANDQTAGTGVMGANTAKSLKYEFNMGVGQGALSPSVSLTQNNDGGDCLFVQCGAINSTTLPPVWGLNADIDSMIGNTQQGHTTRIKMSYHKSKRDNLTSYNRQLNVAGFIRQPNTALDIPPIVLGGFVGTGRTDSTLNSLGFLGNIPSKGLYIRSGYRDEAGLTYKIGYAYSKGQVQIRRTESSPNTDSSVGYSTMRTRAIIASVGYGVAVNKHNVVTPYGSITQTTGHRSGYTEQQAIFPITYTPYKIKTTTAQFGVRGKRTLSRVSRLLWDVGVKQDVKQKVTQTTGTSAMPGMKKFTVPAPRLNRKYRKSISLEFQRDFNKTAELFTGVNITQSKRKNKHNRSYTIGIKIGL